MANKRDLKHAVNQVCNDLFAECVALSLYGSAPEENVKALLSSIIIIRNDFISRISHPEPGMEPRAYYQHIKRDFETQVESIIDQLRSLG